MRVVIIDDSAIFRRRMASLLTFLGHRICGLAENAVLGAEIVASQHPDIVMIDNEMPDMSGLECVKMIRFTNAGTRIILVSCGLTPEDAMELSRMGTDAMLLKPICEAKLENLLKQFAAAAVLG